MADIYFDLDNGDDTTGDGSVGNPWKTLSKSHTEAAASGDDLVLKDGTYVLAANLTTNISKDVTIRSQSSDPTLCIIDGDSNQYYYRLDITNVTVTFSFIQYKDFIGAGSYVQTLTYTNNNLTNVGSFI